MSSFLKNLHPLLRRKQNPKDNQDPNFALVDAISEEMNKIERDTIESKLQSSLKTATTEYLDKFGDWFGVYRREKEPDDKYRARIIKYLLLKRGTNNSIIEAIKDYLGKEDVDVSVYEPFTNIFYTNKSKLNGEDHLMGYYYRFAVINVSIGDYFPIEIVDVINDFKPAGVTLYLTYDGASTITGGYIIDWLKDLPKVETYQEIDRLTGYDDTFYGHLNMGASKKSDNSKSETFKTNHSLINSTDVLTGSSTVGRKYINYGFITSYVYTPTKDASVSQIGSSLSERGQEVPTDYYLYTSIRDTNKVNIKLETMSGVSYVYNNFNVRDYLSKTRPDIDLHAENVKQFISDYVKEVTVDYYLSAVLQPSEHVDVNLQVYDFKSNTWHTVSQNDVSFYEKNIGVNIGYIKDYLNDDLNLFLRIEVNVGFKDSVDLNINYLDVSFTYYKYGVYTVKPFTALIEEYTQLTRDSFVNLFKVSYLHNEDIMTKPGYQPIKYLKLVGNYDKVKPGYVSISALDVNNNFIDNTELDTYSMNKVRNLLQSYNNTSNVSKDITSTREFTTSGWAKELYSNSYVAKTLTPGKTYTLSFDMEITANNTDFKSYSDNHGIYLHSSTKGVVVNGVRSIERTIGNKITISQTFTAPTITDHRFLLYTGRYTSDGKASTPPVFSNAVKITNLQLTEGDTQEAYTPAPEDIPNRIERGIQFNSIRTDIKSFNIYTDTDLNNATLYYSYYGDEWVELKRIGNISTGNKTETNNLIDLYGLQTVDYSTLNPMSTVALRSVWNVRVGDINTQQGNLVVMSNNFFNTTWQETDLLSTASIETLMVVQDIYGGVLDNSSGDIIYSTVMNVSTDTLVDSLVKTVNLYEEPLTLGSERYISSVEEEPLTVETITIDNRIKVVDTYSEIIPN